MSEQTDIFRVLQDERRQRHCEWERLNMEILQKHGLFGRITNNGECVVFTRPVKVDFYPSTGRWRSGGRTYGGGAEKFNAWYSEQMRNLPPDKKVAF